MRAIAAETDLHSEQKRNSFLMDNISADRIDLAERFHLVKINLDSIKKKIGTLIIKKEKNKLSFDDLWESVKFISLAVERMKVVFSYGLKAKFNTEDENIKADLFDFIYDYCINVIKKLHDDIEIVVLVESKISPVLEFSPQDVGALLENVVSNSKKFKAKSITIKMNNSPNYYLIDIIDDGEGIDKTIIKNADSLFEFGKGFTSSGSGVGLYHVKKIVNDKFHGDISINSERSNGFELIIRLPK